VTPGRAAKALAALTAVAWATAVPWLHAAVVSYTLDFQHPDGSGSAYADAIPLSTAGAARDRNGLPIGFTHVTSGDESGDGRISAVERTAAGLVFDLVTAATVPGHDNSRTVFFGVPFNTTGWISESGTPTRITARVTSIVDFDANYEQIAVGWGVATTNSASANTVWSMILHNSGYAPPDRYQTADNNVNHRWTTGSYTDGQAFTIRKTGATQFRGDYDGTTDIVTDTSPNGVTPLPSNDANSFAYFWGTGSSTTGDVFSFILTAITFEGPALVVPTIVPEPGTAAAVALGAWALRRRRRRSPFPPA